MKKMVVGSVVKSLDFAGNPDNYVLGVVFEIGEETFRMRGFERVWATRASEDSREYIIPLEGQHFMDANFPGRVKVIA